MDTYDVLVLGVGAMGSVTLYNLAQRGLKTLGIDRYEIPNDMGSSHGITRIIRLAYYEDPSYVPLLRRAYELWRELEERSGEALLHTTGSIDAGPRGSFVFEGSRESCRLHGLDHEILSGSEVNRRFPGYGLPEDSMAVHQPDGGFLLPEKCISAFVDGAVELGAEVRGREQVLSWGPEGEGVAVTTDKGRYLANSLVVCSGAWAGRLVPELRSLAVPERQVLAWFQPLKSEHFKPEVFPVFNLMVEEGKFYGFPIYGVPGFKLGRYHHLYQQLDDVDAMDRDVHPEDEELLRSFTKRYFPGAAGTTVSLKTCIFTNTPDEHFIMDRHPAYPQVHIAAGFSGHGFKFASVVGEIMADMAADTPSAYDLSLFKLSRFAD